LERERHLNAVLRAIRNVNQLITREKDRGRLLRKACEILAETRGFHRVWIAGLTPDRRVEAAVEAGIGAVFAGVRAQLERGELPECCRRALASEAPIVMANPVTHCIACPVAPQYRDGTVGMAVAMRHGGKVYGMLVAALPAEMADDTGELSLFREVASDLAFALYDIELEQQHKRAVEALRKSEARYRSLVDTAIAGVYETSLDGTFLYANEAMATILEMDSVQQLLHTKAQNLYKDPSHREELLHTLRGAGKAPAFEVTMLTSRGNERQVLLEATLKDDSIQGMMVDITERTRLEELLRGSEQLYRTVVESAQDIISITVADSRVFVNKAYLEVFGFQEMSQAVAYPVGHFVVPEDRERVSAWLLAHQRGGPAPGVIQYGIRRLDGQERTLEGSVSLFAYKGQPAVLRVSRDITERKQAEKALQESEQLYRAVVDNANDAISISMDGIRVFANGAFLKLHGLQYMSQAVGLPVEQFMVPVDKNLVRQRSLARQQGANLPAVNEYRIHRADGEERTAEVSVSLVTYKGQPAVLAVIRDITERKQYEKALTESNRLLGEAMAQMKATERQIVQQERLQALGQMASGIAHDFNNSLTPILGFSQILLTHPENLQDTETVKGYLEMINLSARDAAVVVRRLRDFYQTRETTESFGPVRLDEIVGQAISLTQAKWKDQAQAKGITINIETELGDVPPNLGNQAELRQALANLILNAVDAMPNGGKIILSTRREQDHVILSVSDTGTGMTEEIRRRCLEPFFTTKGEKGSGMGLPAVYGVAQQHGGTLEIETEVGKGSTFTIRLPIMIPKRAERDLSEPVASHFHILVADDQPMVRQLISEYLLADGHTVEGATNGKDALEKFASGSFDLVVTDRAMPEMSGDQLALAIKELAPAMPVILLTGVGDIMQDAKEKPKGVDVILGKPPDLTDLRQAIRSCLTNGSGDEP
ncbi:MAG: PAS domain S-box protein, partial [Chloroflexota bacterium]